MKKSLIFVFSFILLVPIFIGCKEEDNDTPPIIPPYESIRIAFNNFYIDTDTLGYLNTKHQISDYNTQTNYRFATESVDFWDHLLTVTLIIPVRSYYFSFIHTPTYLGNNKWEWNFNMNSFTSTYTIHLTGELGTTDIKWEMYIGETGDEGFPEFKWLEGTSHIDGNSGQWFLYHSYQFQEEVLQIDWTKSGKDIVEKTYTYIRELNDNRETEPFNGSYLIYVIQNDYYDGHNSNHFYDTLTTQFVDVDIEWSTTEYYGHVKAEHKFGDTEWHCWDDFGNDTSCN
ncbi:hypothetical protein ACFLSE_10410 [Bacteroidota bacterium]